MKNLKIPMAKDESGLMVQPDEATKESKYFCPDCNSRIIFRHKEGGRNIAHFSHPANSVCTNESILHKTAKLLVTQLINGYINGKNSSPIIERVCSFCEAVTEQKLGDNYTKAIVEKHLDSKFIADVAIESNGIVEAVIEIKVTHAVSEYKQQEIKVPFIELEGEDVVKDPMHWKPILDKFPPFKCNECEEIKRRFWKRLVDVSKQTNVELPKKYYRTTVDTCYHCSKDFLIFDWPGRVEDDSIPKSPRPKTLRHQYSKTVNRKYWANTCPRCNYFIGEFYQPDLLNEFSVDSVESYKADMKTLAIKFVNSRADTYEMIMHPEPLPAPIETLPYKNILMQTGVISFKCISCGATWKNESQSDTICPKCNEYLYTRIEN